jgi:hypothetical protein
MRIGCQTGRVKGLLDMGCLFSNARLGHEVVIPRSIAAPAVAAIASAAAADARNRWERELATWLAAQARALAAGAPGFDVGDFGWTPDHFTEQQRFVIDAIAVAAPRQSTDLRFALDHLATLIAGHDRAWVAVGRRWSRPDWPVTTGQIPI